jgi:uncharacterized protein (UPF0276 family)
LSRPLECIEVLAMTRVKIGIGYRPEIRDAIMSNRQEIDILEVFTERYFDASHDFELSDLRRSFSLVAHGLRLSIGSAESISERYKGELAQSLTKIRPLWFSDHLGMTGVDGVQVDHFLPVTFDDEMIDRIVRKTLQIKRAGDMPFLLENVTYYFPSGGSMPEWEFIARVAVEADCSVLLDLANLHANAVNHRYDPYEFLDGIPLERVGEIHLAGGAMRGGMYVDTHAHSVPRDVWQYLLYIAPRLNVCAVVLERDRNFPAFSELMGELRFARGIIAEEVTQI